MRVLTLTLSMALVAGFGLAGCDQIDTGKGPVVDSGKPTNDASPRAPADQAPVDRAPADPRLTPPVSPPVTPPVTSPGATTPESTPSRSSTTTAPGTTADTTPPPGTRPDNTAINQRDADLAKAKTPIDQDENQADIDITSKIRQRVLDQQNFSINARNAKIITSQGMVTLRGPVNSKQEADTIERIAKEVAGDGKVDNQLEIAPQER
jgi:hypothetical protein